MGGSFASFYGVELNWDHWYGSLELFHVIEMHSMCEKWQKLIGIFSVMWRRHGICVGRYDDLQSSQTSSIL